jgi:hypothetical protein
MISKFKLAFIVSCSVSARGGGRGGSSQNDETDTSTSDAA